MHIDTHIHIYIHTHPYTRRTCTHTRVHTHTQHRQSSEFPFVLSFITLIPTPSGCGQQGVGGLHHIFYFTKNALVQRQENLPSTFLTHLNPPVQRPLVFFVFFKSIQNKIKHTIDSTSSLP